MHKHLDMLDRGGLWKVTQTVIALLNIVETYSLTYVKCLAIWYHLHNFKTPSWVFFTFLKLYKWYQIAQSITYRRSLSCIFLSH